MSLPGRARRTTWLFVALAALAVAALLSVALGVRAVGWSDIVAGLSGDHDTVGAAAVAKRVPRTALAVLVGGSLGLAGAVMQGVTRNPLADPALLGVTSGSALAVVCGIAFFGLAAPSSYLAVAILGAAAAAVLVHAVGSLGRGGPTTLKLALAGAACTAAFSSMVSAVLLPRIDVMNEFRFWQIGGVGGADWHRIGMVAPLVLTALVVCMGAARGLDALALGDDAAAGLGVHVGRTRLVAGLAAIVLCGSATAVAGPIGFVGLVVPHLCRLLVGSAHRWLLPLSLLVGAALLTLADVLGRVVARPAELDVGIVTAVLGAPFFIALVRRAAVRAL